MGACHIILHYEDSIQPGGALPSEALVEIWHYATKKEAHALFDKMLALELEERSKIPPEELATTKPRTFTMLAHPGKIFATLNNERSQ